MTTGAIAVLPYMLAAPHGGRVRLGYFLVPALRIRAVQLTWIFVHGQRTERRVPRESSRTLRDAGVLAAYGHANCGRPTYRQRHVQRPLTRLPEVAQRCVGYPPGRTFPRARRFPTPYPDAMRRLCPGVGLAVAGLQPLG